eukprot:COSAG02_NODE_9177_length_2300_cov_4.630622_3_plen_296_part_00
MTPGKCLFKQIKKMIANPDKVQKYVGIFEITDRDHPAYVGRKSDVHPPYGALALRDLPSHKVLGAYGGLTKLDTADEQLDSSADRADCQFGLHVDQLFVDADKCCNHLAFFNDFRTDTVHYYDPKRQKGYRKCKGGAKNSRHNTEVLIAWKDNELFPRVFFITNRAVHANEELMINYGDAYWKSIYDLKQSENNVGGQGQEDAAGTRTNATSQLTSASPAKPNCVSGEVEHVIGEVLSALVHTITEDIGTNQTSMAGAPVLMCADLESSDSESEIDLTGDTSGSSDDDMGEVRQP